MNNLQKALANLFSLDYRLLIKKEKMVYGMARVTVVDNVTNQSFSQLTPCDHHLLDEKLANLIDYCANELTKKTEKPEVENKEGEVE